MASNEKIINKYLKAAKKDCPKRLQKMLDTELKGSLIEFCNDKVSVTYELLENHFGKPEQCVAEYISSLDGININKKLCRSKRIWIAVISALIVIIILAIGTGIYMIKWNREHQPEQYEFKITEESSNEQNSQ